jgi:hypothetical protein
MGLDLKVYLDRYQEMFKRDDGLPYDIPSIEKRFAPLRDERNWLTPAYVEWILHRDNAPFGNYWPTPHPKHLDQLSTKRLSLDLRSQGKKEVVGKLLGVVHDIGVTSIILRFVHPDCFGVFSSPVHAVLLVNRMSTLDLYLAYCEELSEYKSHFGLLSVAQVEMAITAVYEIMKGKYGKKESEAAQKSFRADLWVQRRRAGNVVRPFLRDFGKLPLAKILLHEDARLAGIVAGVEFERLLGLASMRFRGQKLTFESGAIADLLKWLTREERISWNEKRSPEKVKRIRNSAVHGLDPQPTSKEEVEWMIDEIEKICSPWKLGPGTRGAG